MIDDDWAIRESEIEGLFGGSVGKGRRMRDDRVNETGIQREKVVPNSVGINSSQESLRNKGESANINRSRTRQNGG